MRLQHPSLVLLSPLVLSLASACRPSPPDPQFVAQWLQASLAFERSERLASPVAARISAYASIALYEGYAADPQSRLRSLAGQMNGLWSVPVVEAEQPIDGATVAAEAERVVLDSLFSEGSPGTRRSIDSLADAQIEARRRAGIKDGLRDRSLTHGHALGNTILAWAASDGFFATRGRAWQSPKATAKWVSVGEKPTEPHWGTLRPFALRNGLECAPPPPPAYSERRNSDFWRMGKAMYDSVSALTPEKKAVALYWADGPGATGSPGFYWIGALHKMIPMRRLTADQAAEAYVLTSVAIADAFIGGWREKYHSLAVRPVTYVRRAFDPRWEPLVATPPFPEYPAGQSTLSGAAVTVLVKLLGDSIPFGDSTQTETFGAVRSFRNFTHARDEAAVSQVYGGVQFFPAIVHGLAQGQCVGTRVLARLRTRVGPS